MRNVNYFLFLPSLLSVYIEESFNKLDEFNDPANSKSKKSKAPEEDNRNKLRKVYDDYLKDLGILESWYDKKMLIVEVS